MTLVDAWNHGGIVVPWGKLAKSNRYKLFRERKQYADYYLIGGKRQRNNKTDNDELVILELSDDGKGRILIDIPASKTEKIKERIKIVAVNVDILAQAIGRSEPADKSKGQTSYDPTKQYVLDRAKVGRPHRILTDEEQAGIRRLRSQGLSINAIAKELGINNRRVMEYCKNILCNT